MTRVYFVALLLLSSLIAACSQPGGSEPIAPTVTGFRAEKSTITEGESTTLVWSAVDADAILTLTPDVGDVTDKTSVTVSPIKTTEYTLTATNQAGSNAYKATVTVTPKGVPTPTNRPPTARSVAKSTREGTTVTVQLSGSDPDGDPLRYSIVAEPQNGSLSGLNPDTGEVTYTPNANFSGADSFTFSVSDGKLSSAPANVTVNVAAVNDAPTANPQTRSTPEETPVVVTLFGSDPEGADLDYAIARQPNYGTLGALDPATRKVTYTPTTDYNGSDSFSFVVSDGELTSAEATVIVKVGVVNDQPVAKPQDVTLEEDNAKTITLTATDPDNDALTYAVVKQPDHGKLSGLNAATGKVTYTPYANYSGSDSFTFKANDGTEDSEVQTVSLTINPVNDAPVIAGGDSVSVPMSEDGEPTAFALTLNASDVDSDTLTWSVSSAAAHGTASVSGTGVSKDVAYSPNANYNGSDKFVVKVVDGDGAEDTITVNVTIASVNDGPTALTLSNDSVEENKSAGTVVGTFSTADVDNDKFTYKLVGGEDDASFEIDGDTLKTKAAFDFETKVSYTIKVQSSDGQGGTITETFTVKVADVEDYILNVAISGDGTVTSTLPGINCDTVENTDCSEVYNAGTEVTLSAQAADGAVFDGWSGDDCTRTDTDTCVVTMDAAKSVTANFSAIPPAFNPEGQYKGIAFETDYNRTLEMSALVYEVAPGQWEAQVGLDGYGGGTFPCMLNKADRSLTCSGESLGDPYGFEGTVNDGVWEGRWGGEVSGGVFKVVNSASSPTFNPEGQFSGTAFEENSDSTYEMTARVYKTSSGEWEADIYVDNYIVEIFSCTLNETYYGLECDLEEDDLGDPYDFKGTVIDGVWEGRWAGDSDFAWGSFKVTKQ